MKLRDHQRALFDSVGVPYLEVTANSGVIWFMTKDQFPITRVQAQNYADSVAPTRASELTDAIMMSLGTAIPSWDIRTGTFGASPVQQAPLTTSTPDASDRLNTFTTVRHTRGTDANNRARTFYDANFRDKDELIGEIDASGLMVNAFPGLAIVDDWPDGLGSSFGTKWWRIYRLQTAGWTKGVSSNMPANDVNNFDTITLNGNAAFFSDPTSPQNNFGQALSALVTQEGWVGEVDTVTRTFLTPTSTDRVYAQNVIPGKPYEFPLTAFLHGNLGHVDIPVFDDQSFGPDGPPPSEEPLFRSIRTIYSAEIAAAIENIGDSAFLLTRGYSAPNIDAVKKQELLDLAQTLRDNEFKARVVRYYRPFTPKKLREWHSQWGELTNEQELGGDPIITVKQFDNKYVGVPSGYAMVLYTQNLKRDIIHVTRTFEGVWDALPDTTQLRSDIMAGKTILWVDDRAAWLQRPDVQALPEEIQIAARDPVDTKNAKLLAYINDLPPVADSDAFVEFFLHTRLNEDRELVKFILYIDGLMSEVETKDFSI